jgi:bifunctional DNase/RNase/DNA-binding transcriptional MerR regulator
MSPPRSDLESIGKFSRRSGISVGQLRHYHDVGLLQAAYVDPESGYRYYAAAQAQAAEVIGLLRAIDMPVRDIQRLLADPGEANVRKVLAAHRERLEARLTQVANRLESIDRIVKEGKLVKQPGGASNGGLVPVHVKSVHTRRPSIERWQELRKKLPTPMPEEPQEVHIVTLVAADGRRIPIWVGSFEGQAVKLQLDGLKTERPMTYDLMLQALESYGVRITAADILRIEDATFFARLKMVANGKESTFDCRPSDAINLALRANAGIAVAEEVLEEAGLGEGEDDA